MKDAREGNKAVAWTEEELRSPSMQEKIEFANMRS